MWMLVSFAIAMSSPAAAVIIWISWTPKSSSVKRYQGKSIFLSFKLSSEQSEVNNMLSMDEKEVVQNGALSALVICVHFGGCSTIKIIRSGGAPDGRWTLFSSKENNVPVRFHYVGHNTMLEVSHVDKYDIVHWLEGNRAVEQSVSVCCNANTMTTANIEKSNEINVGSCTHRVCIDENSWLLQRSIFLRRDQHHGSENQVRDSRRRQRW